MALGKKKTPKTAELGEEVGIKQPDQEPQIPILPYVTQGDLLIMERLDKIIEVLEAIQKEG